MWRRLVVVGGLSVCLAISLAWWWYRLSLRPVASQPSQPREFRVQSGWGGKQIAQQLADQGLIRSSLAFYLFLRQQGKAGQLHAGVHWISPNMDANQILAELLQSQAQIKVTLLEGWRREQMAEELTWAFASQTDSQFDKQEFLRLTEQLEGKLFPETYNFSPRATAQQVVNTLTEQFDQVWRELPSHPELSSEQVLILASLVEREADNRADRRGIANVLYTRLEADWPLQVDATLQYIKASQVCAVAPKCSNWWPVVTGDDKQLDSPYNTYLYPGLPPSPIANPGKDSLQAAAQARQGKYWFYLTDKQGQTHFSVSYEEHLQKVNKYLR